MASFKRSKEEKQAFAAKLKEEAAGRTPEQQLKNLDLYGYTATKERARLTAKVAEGQKPTKKEKKS